MNTFIFTGQSNMVGEAVMPPVVPVDSGSLIFGRDYHWHSTTEPSHMQGAYSVDAVNDNTGMAGYGMLTAFAQRMHTYLTEPFGLIPVARAGSPMSAWAYSTDENTLYGAALKRARASLGTPAGIIHFQGESEGALQTEAYKWAENFHRLIDYWRADYGADIPIVFLQLGANPYDPGVGWWDVVKAQQASINRHNVVMVKTDDLLMEPKPGPHFQDAATYDALGVRAADAMATMLPQRSSPVIFDRILQSPAGVFDIQNIPAGYAYIELIYTLRLSGTGTECEITVNGDTSPLYNQLKVIIPSGGQNVLDSFLLGQKLSLGTASATDTPNYPGSGRITFPNYDGTVFDKLSQAVTSRQVNDSAGMQRMFNYSLFYKSTAPITRLTLTAQAGNNFVTGSRVTLIGYK